MSRYNNAKYKITKKSETFLSRFFYIKYKNNYTFISTSTPLGNSSFIKASIVLDEDE
jgi:hypothetical protein